MKPKLVIQKKKTQKPLQVQSLQLPPGARLSDIFIDGAEVIAELFISKRTLLNWRSTGKISYCDRFGKIFYFKQEIAQILLEGKKRVCKGNLSKNDTPGYGSYKALQKNARKQNQ